jgi:hypothetical protein
MGILCVKFQSPSHERHSAGTTLPMGSNRSKSAGYLKLQLPSELDALVERDQDTVIDFIPLRYSRTISSNSLGQKFFVCL